MATQDPIGLFELCAAWNVRSRFAVPPCNAFAAAIGSAYTTSIENSSPWAAAVVLINRFVTGVPETIVVATPAAVLYVVGLLT